MTTNVRDVAYLLWDYAQHLARDLEKRAGELEALPEPETQAECDALEERLNRNADALRYFSQAEQTRASIRRDLREHQHRLREMFAGSWPPTNPLDLLAMTTTIIRDYDEMSGTGYLSEYEDFGEGGGPVSDAWLDLRVILQSLPVDTVETATAVYHAWKQDDEVGCGGEWSDETIAQARLLAMPTLPRPR